MGQDCAVGKTHFVGAAEALVGIPWVRGAAPQLHSARVEIPDHSRGLTGIDGYRTQVKQGAIAFFVFVPGFLGLPARGDVVDRQQDILLPVRG